MRLLLLVAIVLIASGSKAQQPPWTYKKTNIKCISGECRNGEGLAFLYHTICRAKCEGCSPDCYQMEEVIHLVKGHFEKGDLNGFASIAVPDVVSNKKLESYKKELKNTFSPSGKFSADKFPFKLNYIVEGEFKDNIPTGSFTCYDATYTYHHNYQYDPPSMLFSNSFKDWINTNENILAENKYPVKGRRFHLHLEQVPFGYKNRSETPPYLKVDSAIVLLENGRYKVAKTYEQAGDKYFPTTAYKELTIGDSTTIRMKDYELGWDLVVEKHDDKTTAYRELAYEFDNTTLKVGRSQVFPYPEDQNNYAEKQIDPRTTYRGGTNEKGEPHGFGVMTKLLGPDYNVWNSGDTVSATKVYQRYSGYFENGDKKYLGRELKYKVKEKLKVQDKDESWLLRDTSIVTKTFIEEYLGEYRQANNRSGQGRFVTYFDAEQGEENYGKIRDFYTGYYEPNSSSLYPYKGRHADLSKVGNRFHDNSTYESGFFDAQGNKIVTAYDIQKMEEKREKERERRKKAQGCPCHNCGGSGKIKTPGFKTSVSSYNKQETRNMSYLGLSITSTYRVTEVSSEPTYSVSNCEVCGGRGNLPCD